MMSDHQTTSSSVYTMTEQQVDDMLTAPESAVGITLGNLATSSNTEVVAVVSPTSGERQRERSTSSTLSNPFVIDEGEEAGWSTEASTSSAVTNLRKRKSAQKGTTPNKKRRIVKAVAGPSTQKHGVLIDAEATE
jgi:hypothetical protein